MLKNYRRNNIARNFLKKVNILHGMIASYESRKWICYSAYK